MRRFNLVWLPVLSVLVISGLMPRSACAQMDNKFPVRAEVLIKDYVQSGMFSGTVLVAKNGKPIFQKGFGAANREWAIPNTTTTKFRIGSIGKQFTAVAILRLVDENKLALDDAIKKYLPDVPAHWEKVSIRELLAHTSGIPSYTGIADFDDKIIRIQHTPEQLSDMVKDAPLYFEPGTKFRYSNTGYVLLGRIIETVSGLRYQDYLENKLLRPLHLNNSGYDDGRKVVAHAAQAYTDGVDSVVKAAMIDMSNAYSAGAMYSTTGDLLAWQQMLMNAKVLSPETTAVMIADGGHRNGLGLFIRDRFSRKVVEHGGAVNGFNSMLAYYPGEKLTIIVLSNYAEELVAKISDELARLALGLPPAHRQVKVDSQLYTRFAGRYQLEPDLILSIVRKDERLFAQLSGQKQIEIYPESEYSYFYKAVDAVVTFDKELAGKVAYLTLHQDGTTLKAKRID